MRALGSSSLALGAVCVAALPSAPSGGIRHVAARDGARQSWRGSRSVFAQRSLSLRGGGDDAEATSLEPAKDEPPASFLGQLYTSLKENRSLDPNDHPSSLQWVLAVLLAGYIAVGAPLAGYVPGMKELATVAPKEVPLTQAQLERMEREALRKEQEEEYEKALMEDSLKQAEADAKQEALDKAEREAEAAASAKTRALADYSALIEEATARLAAEPADGLMLRLRCPDGLQLTRKFSSDSPVQQLYDFVDISRHQKVVKAPDADEKLLALAELQYQLVSTMPKLVLKDKAATLSGAGIKSSCALMVQPLV